IMNMSFMETMIYTNTGGILGVLIFTFFSKSILHLGEKWKSSRHKIKQQKRKIFTKRNRRLVKIKSTYGLPGIVILTPVLLSIPVGVFLLARYFGKQLSSYLWLILSQFVWSFIYSVFYLYVRTLLVPL